MKIEVHVDTLDDTDDTNNQIDYKIAVTGDYSCDFIKSTCHKIEKIIIESFTSKNE